MSGSIPVIFFKETYTDGTPLSGGLLYAYAAGTNTPKTTYTEPTGNVASAFPIVLNSAGRCSVWLGTGGYKFLLTDSLGNTIWTKDNIGLSSTDGIFSSVSSISDLRALSSGYASTIYVIGPSGSGYFYRWNPSNSSSDNNWSIIAPNSAPASGRWELQYDGEIDVDFLGGFKAAWNKVLNVPVTLLISTAQTVDASIDIDPHTSVKILYGGTISGPYTVRFYGPFEAGDYNVFGSDIAVQFRDVSIPVLKSVWFSTFKKSTDAATSFIKTVVLSKDIDPGEDVTIASNVKLVVQDGGAFNNLTTGPHTITIGGGFEASLKTVFKFGITAVFTGPPKTVYPEWWGALGDGSTDDHDAINSAIATGQEVSFNQKSTYIVGSRISSFVGNQKIMGYGSTVKRKDNSITDWDGSGEIFLVSSVDGVEVYGLQMDGNKSNNSSINKGDGIKFEGSNRNIVENTYWHSFGRDSIVLSAKYTAGSPDTYAPSSDNIITNNRIWDIGLVGMNGGNGIAVTHGSRNIITNNNIKGDSSLASAVTSCIDIEPNTAINECSGNVIKGNTCDFVRLDQGIANYVADKWILTFKSAGYTSAVFGDIGKTVVQGGVTGILNNYNNTKREWYVDTVSGYFINNVAVTITTGTGAGTLDPYISPRSTVNCTVIEGNTLFSSDTSKSGAYAMRIRQTSGLTIKNNTIRHGSQYAFRHDGINMSNIIEGNTIFDSDGPGISSPNGAYECQFVNNIIRGNAGEGITLNGGNHVVVKGNKVSFNGLVGIALSGNTFAELEGNVSHDNQQEGIKVFGSSYVNILNNKSVDNGLATANTYDAIIVSGTHDFVTINDNLVGSQAATVNKCRYGINDSTSATTGGSTRLARNEYLYFGTTPTNLTTGFTQQWDDENLFQTQQITNQAGGYVSCVIGDLGKTVVGGTSSASGRLILYNNATRVWTIAFAIGTSVMTPFQAAEAVTITTGTGAGTTSSVSLNNPATFLDLKSKFTWSHGTVAPEGVVQGRVGSWYIQPNGTSGQIWWMKDNGTGTTGWTQVARVEKNIYFRSAVPASGTWALGDLVFDSNPSDGASTGWICTVAGSPGTWRTIGSWINSQWGEDLSMQSTFAFIGAAGTTGKASLRIPHGVAPTSPVNGDMWTTTSGLFVRINGSTVGPLT